jgi:hypothetical protein
MITEYHISLEQVSDVFGDTIAEMARISVRPHDLITNSTIIVIVIEFLTPLCTRKILFADALGSYNFLTSVTSFSEQLPLLKQSGYVLLHKCASRNK